MGDVTPTITLPDIEAQALAMVVASLGRGAIRARIQCWLNHWKADDVFSPQVEANMVDLMREASRRFTRRSQRWSGCAISPWTSLKGVLLPIISITELAGLVALRSRAAPSAARASAMSRAVAILAPGTSSAGSPTPCLITCR